MASQRVLIVDDHCDSAEALQRLIEAWGHEATVAFDGNAAVEEAKTRRPAVVLMDINMPVMDGYQAARLLRLAHDDVLLIAMTGAPEVETQGRAHDAGFHHHYVKPIDLDELRKLLDSDSFDHVKPAFRLYNQSSG